MFLFDTFSQFDNAHRQVTNSFYLLLICIAEMINRKSATGCCKEKTLWQISSILTSSLSILFSVFFTSCFPKQALKALP
jgi:hypothetical protein